jgi:transposase
MVSSQDRNPAVDSASSLQEEQDARLHSEVGEVEVSAKATRRVFTTEYKERILREADAFAGQHGKISALLRREGIYWSHLTAWRREARAGLAAKKRGPKGKVDPRDRKLEELERKVAQLIRRAERVEALVGLSAGTARTPEVARQDPPNEDCGQ